MNLRLIGKRHILVLCLLAWVIPVKADCGIYENALVLYSQGMYQRAKVLFEECPQEPLSADYALLCSIKLNSPDVDSRVAASENESPRSILYSQIHREYALLLFEREDYAFALGQFEKVNVKDLSGKEAGEYWYKKGYCLFASESFAEAKDCFLKSVEYATEYTYPGYFAIGMIEYNYRNFPFAQRWFEKSVNDPRFSEVSAFYLVDCHFMAKDYDYVIKYGEAMFPTIPQERKKYLSRMLSESFLVKGDAASARKYLTVGGKMSSADYFHAGSVLYAVGDYSGAIQNFDRMGDRADSLSPISY